MLNIFIDTSHCWHRCRLDDEDDDDGDDDDLLDYVIEYFCLSSPYIS